MTPPRPSDTAPRLPRSTRLRAPLTLKAGNARPGAGMIQSRSSKRSSAQRTPPIDAVISQSLERDSESVAPALHGCRSGLGAVRAPADTWSSVRSSRLEGVGADDRIQAIGAAGSRLLARDAGVPSCMDTSSQRVAAALSRMRERDGVRSRAGVRLLLVPHRVSADHPADTPGLRQREPGSRPLRSGGREGLGRRTPTGSQRAMGRRR